MLAFLADQPTIAFDTESNSMYAYRERVCLVQCTAGGRDYIVDPFAVDIHPLADLFADPNVEKIFHAAEYDVFCLRREFEFRFANLFDTMISARILGWKKVGLSSLLEEHFGVRLDKKMQRHDWGRRPLTTKAIDYARLDTVYLEELRNIVSAALEEAGREAEAQAAFQRVAELTPPERVFDPEGFWRLKRLKQVPKEGLARFRELYVAREEIGRLTDRAVHRVASESALVLMATEPPRTTRDLQILKGADRRLLARHGRLVFDALERAEGQPIPKRPPKPSPPSPEVAARVDRLKAWRRAICEARGVESDVVMANKVLVAIANAAPGDARALEELGALDGWQLEEYGGPILRALDGGG